MGSRPSSARARDVAGHDGAGVGDEAAHQAQIRAGDRDLAHIDRRRVLGHHDRRAQARPRGVGRPGAAGVPRRRQGHAPNAQLARPRQAHGRAARLERARRQQPLVFDGQRGEPYPLGAARQRQQRRHRLAKRGRLQGPAQRQQLSVAPQGPWSRGQNRAPCLSIQPPEVVAHQQRLAVGDAQVLRRVGVVARAAGGALQARQERAPVEIMHRKVLYTSATFSQRGL